MNENVDDKILPTKQGVGDNENVSEFSEQLNNYEQSEHKVKEDLDKYAKLIKETDLKVDQLREEIVFQINQATDRFNNISEDRSIPQEKLSQLSDKIRQLNLTLDNLKQNDATIKHLHHNISKLRNELESINLKKEIVAKNLETLIYQEIALTSPNSVIANPNVNSSKYRLHKIRHSRQILEKQLDGFLQRINIIEEKLKKNFSRLRKQRQSIENFWEEHLDNNFKEKVQNEPQLYLAKNDPWLEVLGDGFTSKDNNQPRQISEQESDLVKANSTALNEPNGDRWPRTQANEVTNKVPIPQSKNPSFVDHVDQPRNADFDQASALEFISGATSKNNFGNQNNQFNQNRLIAFDEKFNQDVASVINKNRNRQVINDSVNRNTRGGFDRESSSLFFRPEVDEKVFSNQTELQKAKSFEEELKSAPFALENATVSFSKPLDRARIASFDEKATPDEKIELGGQTDELKKHVLKERLKTTFFSPGVRRNDFDQQQIESENFGKKIKEFGKNDLRSDDRTNKSVKIMNDNNQVINRWKIKNMDYNDSFSPRLGWSRDSNSISSGVQPNSHEQATKKIGIVDFSPENLSNTRPDFLKNGRSSPTGQFRRNGRFLEDEQLGQEQDSSDNNPFSQSGQVNQSEHLLRSGQRSKTKQIDQSEYSSRSNKFNQNRVNLASEQVDSDWTSNNLNLGDNALRFQQQQRQQIAESEINNSGSSVANYQKNLSKSKPNYYEFITALDKRLALCKDFLESSEINAAIVERFIRELNDISNYFQNLISQLQKNFSLIVLFKNDVLRLLPDKQKICDRFMNFNAKFQSAEAKKEYSFFFTFYDEFKRRFNSVRAKIFTDLNLFNSFTNDLKEMFEWIKANVSPEDPIFWIDCNELLEFWSNLRSHYDRSGNNASVLDSMLGKVLKKIESRLDNLDTDLENISNQVALVVNDSDSFANIWDDSASKVDELLGTIQAISNAVSSCVQELNNIFDEAIRNIDDGTNTSVISQINRALEYFYNSKGVFANQIKDFDFRFSEVKYSYEQFLTKKQTIVERERELNLAINNVNSNQYVLAEWIKQCHLTLDNSLNSLKVFAQKIALNQQRLFATYNAFLNKYTNIKKHVLALKDKEKGIFEKEILESHNFSVQKFFENSMPNLEEEKSQSNPSLLEGEKIEEINKGLMNKTEGLLRQLSEYNTGELGCTKPDAEQVD